MSLYPILWAAEHAPIYDAEERSILVALVMRGDFDGCNCFRSRPALAKAARVDPKTVDRKLAAMETRGLIRRQPGPKPDAWLKLPRDKRTVVWEALIPHEFWSAVQLEEINASRIERGRDPITPENRPHIPDAPPKKTRADKGKARPNAKRGDSKSSRPKGERLDLKSSRGGTSSPVATGLQVHQPSDVPSDVLFPDPEDAEAAQPEKKATPPPAEDIEAPPAPVDVLATAAAMAGRLDLVRLDAKPKQVVQITYALAEALVRSDADPATVERYAAAKVAEGHTVKYLLGAFEPARLTVGLPAYRSGKAPEAPAERCPDHPGAVRRVDGECSGCWTDRRVAPSVTEADAVEGDPREIARAKAHMASLRSAG